MRDKNEDSAVSNRGGTLDDRCQMCHGRVYLLERHYTPAGRLYHRHCYRGYQRSATLQKSKQNTDKDKENTDKPPSNGSILFSGKTALGRSEKDANCIQSPGSSAGRDGNSTQGARSSAGVIAISSHNPTTSSLFTGLIKALYSTPNYKQHIATTVESVSQTVSPVNSTVGALKASSSSSSSSSTSSTVSSGMIGLRSAVAGRPTTVLTTSNQPSVFAAARSQYLQRMGSPSVPDITPSTVTVSAPRCTAAAVSRNVTSAPSATSSSAVLSKLSPQPLTSSVAAGRPHTTDRLKIITPETTTPQSSSGNVATKPSVTAASVANTVSWSSGMSYPPSTTVAASSTVSTNVGYVSPFFKDRPLNVAITTTCLTSAPVTSLHTSAIKSTPLTPQHPLTVMTGATASHTSGRPFTSPHLSPDQHRLAKNVLTSSGNDSAMVNSLVLKLAEARERKQQQHRPVKYSAVPISPVESIGNTAPVTLSTGNSKMTGTAMTNKTEWQLEAERRQAARNGVYVDPEKKQTSSIQQQIGRKQLPDYDSSSYTPTLSITPPSSLANKMRSLTNNTVTTPAAVDMYMLRPKATAGAGRSRVNDLSLSRLRANRFSPKQSKHSPSEIRFQRHSQFLSKKSASIALSVCSHFCSLAISSNMMC